MLVRRRQGPTKKLAPASAPEHVCAHSYKEDEGLQLEIDCRECNGAHDLSNRKCLAGVVNALTSASNPESIVLRRYTDKRYRGEVVSWIALCASALSCLDRSISRREESSDRRCRTCPASKANVLASLRRALLDNPMGYIVDWAAIRKDIREMMSAQAARCVDAAKCIDDVLASADLQSGVRGDATQAAST